MKAIRILLTERCNANCVNCFNASYRSKNDMDFNEFIELCNYLSSNGIKKLKVMGGEPTHHPYFIEMIKYAQTKFEGVHIFTNALNDKIKKLVLRETDSVVYNSSFINSNFDIEKLIIDQGGSRTFETQVSSDSDIEAMKMNFKNVIHKAIETYGYDKVINKVGINLTLNCVENIFEKKETIIGKWNNIYNFIKNELKIDVKVDHSVPWCFFVNTEMNIKQGIWKCNWQCSGLIDSSLNLRYCNQMPKVLLKIKQDGRFVPFKIIENHLYMANIEKIHINLEKICKNCIFFGSKCNGGCFIHKEFISRESILNNTSLPKK